MWITTNQGQQVRVAALAALKDTQGDALAANSRLRRQFPEIQAADISAALDQATLSSVALDRYDIDATELLLTRDGLEQGTRPEVAKLRAQHIAHSGAEIVIDMSAGLGFDVRAMLDTGVRVIAIERDPTTAAYLRINAPRAQVIDGDSVQIIEDLLPQLGPHDVIFFDPARRTGRRTLDGSRAHPERDPERWSPSWSFVTSLAKRDVRVCAKVTPGFSPALLPDSWSGIWTSMNRDGVEAMVCSWKDGAVRTARMIDETAVDFVGSGIDYPGSIPVSRYLHEPDVSLVNAQLLNDFCIKNHGLHRIDEDSTWLTSQEPLSHPMIRSYRVDAILPNDTKAIRKALIAREIGDITIKSKGMSINTDAMRRELKLPAGKPGTIIIAIANKARVTLLVHHNG